ncbi:alpha/beta fold hydrolase [Bifidobacterium panos]|uniref:GPI inositol-deacylase PGAP1-like alpha/beta domain-containing protein n=1 Tax=Bifidobacterium panos TaxID=2675321 RepID=A0ABX1SWH0_9BIFI|nr:alpha/beta fold hydrolase [Bifidobacterium sp. DSM 109963]NMN02179.1 hypothetical protein [Bifidobacterium sp. DSM 109963]
MSWQVTAHVYGGKQSSPATQEEYRAAVNTLNDIGRALRARGKLWQQSVSDLEQSRLSVPSCPKLQSGLPYSTSGEHVTLPYDQLVTTCNDRAASCESVGNQISDLSDLLVRAHGLYSEAELRSRKIFNEVAQAATQFKPGWATLFLGSVAVGGLIGSWMQEGKVNPAAASRATAPFQEGYMSGIGSLLSGLPLGLGALRTDEVNKAAGNISGVSGPVKNATQGNKLTVRQVESKTEVVGSSTSVAQSLENLRRLGEERLGTIELNSGLNYATIAIQRYERDDGTNAWLVTIPGTDGQSDSPFDWEQNVELMSGDAEQRKKADSARMVVEAMKQAGISSDEPVALIGHSQGGIVAAEIAADQSEQYNIQHVVTAGSPVANHPIPSKTWVTSIEIEDELVAALDGTQNPSTENWLTVRGTVSSGPDETEESSTPTYEAAPVQGSSENYELSHWLKYHQAAYQNASDLGSPSVQSHEEHFKQTIAGTLKETKYYEGRMSR